MDVERWKFLIEERRLNLANAIDSSKQYTKALLTMAGGALGISVTFIKDVTPSPIHLEILFIGFALLGTSIAAIILAFLFTQFAYEKQIDLDSENYRENISVLEAGHPAIEPQRNKWSPFIRPLDVAALLAFVFGLTCIIVFTSINLAHKSCG